MNTPKHTPGPWRANDTDACIWPTVGRRAPIATLFTAQDPDSEGLAESAGYSAEELANMALLASAPELLTEARHALNVLAALATGQLQRVAKDSPAILGLRAAIAKAEGRR